LPGADDLMNRNDGFALTEATYLNVPFREKDEAKALGARWNPERRLWYVPPGLDLGPFQQWLPADLQNKHSTTAPTVLQDAQHDYQLSTERPAMRLSQLLAGVANVIQQLHRNGVWTQVEVVNAQIGNGDIVYLELSERNPQGNVLAQARAIIWGNVARTLLPRFTRETGVELAPGIKLLVLAKPSFHVQYGFSLFIEDIDPQYTLGDLAAKKREIINRLKQEGLFTQNRSLPAPWNYHRVLVVSPLQAAGLGDFQADAQHLQAWGLCEFIYVHARFQGEGAAAVIRQALLEALEKYQQQGLEFDAIAIIRGGGAVNDLAWLNDYELAKTVCTLPLPVLVGIGHERDHTVLDDIANQPFDTPSKVIAGIRQVIKARADEAKSHFELIQRRTREQLHRYSLEVEHNFSVINVQANHSLSQARLQVQQYIDETRQQAQKQLNDVRSQVPTYLTQIQARSKALLEAARSETHYTVELINMHGRFTLQRSREQVELQMTQVAQGAKNQLSVARNQTLALFREVIGQGPEKTLERGFALVRDTQNKIVSSPAQLQVGQEIDIEFKAGHVAAQITQINGAD